MNVITENDVIITKSGQKLDAFWSPAAGTKVAKATKNFVSSGKAAAVLGALTGAGTAASITPVSDSPSTPKKSGMSTGAKIGIAVGAVAVLGLIIYLVKKKK